MNQEGSAAFAAIVMTWGLALLGVSAALEMLWGYPRLVAAGAAVAIAMFVNDVAPVELLFPRVKRIWLWTGALRGITAVLGFSAILYMGFEFTHGYNERIFYALFGGLVVGGMAGTLVRYFRDRREDRAQRNADAEPK